MRQSDSTLVRVLVGAGVGPFAKSSLDKTFSFAVGSWGVRASEAMLQAQQVAGTSEAVGVIAGAVIRVHGADVDAERR